jgi:citrate lyase subunit beta/citryl-CoA lyase
MPPLGVDAQEAGMIRSFLFVPADSERKLEKSVDAGADAVIVDLEDSVAPARRDDARRIAAAHIQDRSDAWVRINALDTEDADYDLEAVMPARPAGIMLPKPPSAADAIDLAARLDEYEEASDIERGSTGIVCLCTERPEALFTLGGYAGATDRLRGLSWGAEDLSAAVGALATRAADGSWLGPYALARSLCLFAAAAAEVAAIDTVYTDFRDLDGLRAYALAARRDGFSGMLAIHPAQVEVINAAFRPDDAEVERARRIVDLFEENPDTGAIGLDGKMLDRPHLVQARRVLALMAADED